MVHIYVDGSFNSKTNHSGWGFVVVSSDEKDILHEDFGKTTNPAMSRQIDGELEATKQALLWVATNKYNEVRIYHDYIGISKWYQNVWKAKKQVAKDYVTFCDSFKKENKHIKVAFHHVYSHTGNKWNEYVDVLAHKGKLVS